MRAELLAGLVLAGSANAQCEYAELLPFVASIGSDFGWTLSVEGDRALVAHPLNEEVQVFERIAGVWTLSGSLVSDGLTPFDEFGKAVSIDGDLAIVGATQDSEIAMTAGAAYVYARTAGVWAFEAKLTASDAAAGDLYGNSVSISGQRAIVGSWRDDEGGDHAGAAYIYERSGTLWTETARLVASDADDFYAFGTAVSLSGGTALITAPWDSHTGLASGSAYIFQGSGTQWVERAKLIPGDAAVGQWFGWSAALSGSTAIVGCWKDSEAGSLAGAAYVFEPVGPANSWIETDKWLASDAASQDGFGHAVALSGDVAIVGAPQAAGSGQAYVFERAGGTFTEVAVVSSRDAELGDEFGYSVSVSPPFALVGALNGDGVISDAGSAYILQLDAEVSNYCTSTANSSGWPARMDYRGCPSLLPNDFTLLASSVPLNQPGLFFAGPDQVQVLFGNGTRCAGGSPVLRLPPFVVSGADGRFEYPLDLQSALATTLTAGSTWNFQAWFRDPVAGGAGFDFSDGLSVRFVP
jgi:hypothetical protein